MKALETYPQFNRNNEHDSDQSSSEYAHVASYGKGRTCGTLSKSEWEASCKFKKTNYENYLSTFFFFIHVFFLNIFSSLFGVCVPKNEKGDR